MFDSAAKTTVEQLNMFSETKDAHIQYIIWNMIKDKKNGFNILYKTKIILEALHGAGTQMCYCKHNKLWDRFPLEEMKYLTFSFPHSGNELKRGVICCGSLLPKSG